MKKEIRELVKRNCLDLEQSNKDFEAIYQVMFRLTNNVLAETNDGYRIQTYTYGEVKHRIEDASAALYARIGASHQYIGLEMENCVDWIVAFWAILRSGNKPYLVNCRHPKSLSQGILTSLKIQYVISNRQTELSAECIDITSLHTDDWQSFTGAFENEIALSTSATSLNEVVCFYTGKEFSQQLLNTEDVLKQNKRISRFYHGNLKQLAFLPFYHIFGLVAVYFWFTYFGRTIVFLKDYAPDTILNTVRKHEVTHIFAVPMLWHTIEKQFYKQLRQEGEKKQKKFYMGLRICTTLQNIFPYAGTRLAKRIMHEVTDQLFGPSVQFCISGGSYLRNSAMELFNGIGYPLHNGYGMSEIGITSVELRDRPKDRNRNSVGRPFHCVEYKLSDEHTLMIKGTTTCYAMMINGTYRKTEEWFDTRDIMELDDKGYYYIRGRIGDSVIGENGENINPDVLEQSFQLADALSFSILGMPDEATAGEILTMIIAIQPYLSAPRLNALLDTIYQTNESLPMASRIQKFYFTYDELAPKTAIKVGRQFVLRGLKQGTIHLIPATDVRNQVNAQTEDEINPELKRKVCSIVAEELDMDAEEIDITAHVMNDLGASSLQYFSIISRLAEEFSITKDFQEEDYKYTIREFCQYIEEYM